MHLILTTVLALASSTLVTSHLHTHNAPRHLIPNPPPQALSASSQFPLLYQLGPTIEGASVDKHGNFYAVNNTNLFNLSDPTTPPLLHTASSGHFFGSSRFTRTLGPLVGDAEGHTIFFVRKEGETLFPPERGMLQPNDFTVSGDEERIYMSGMNFSADTGDLWFF